MQELEESSSNPGSSRCFSKHLIFWPVTAGGLLLDLWSKAAIFNWLQQQHRDSFAIIDGLLQLVLAQNAGAAFGIAAGQTQVLVAVSAVAMVIILAVFFFGKIEHTPVYAALGLFAAGVCGNLWDRIFNGGMVRDFIDVYYRSYHWPAFNIADSMLCVGVGLLIISSTLTERSCRKYAQQHK